MSRFGYFRGVWSALVLVNDQNPLKCTLWGFLGHLLPLVPTEWDPSAVCRCGSPMGPVHPLKVGGLSPPAVVAPYGQYPAKSVLFVQKWRNIQSVVGVPLFRPILGFCTRKYQNDVKTRKNTRFSRKSLKTAGIAQGGKCTCTYPQNEVFWGRVSREASEDGPGDVPQGQRRDHVTSAREVSPKDLILGTYRCIFQFGQYPLFLAIFAKKRVFCAFLRHFGTSWCKNPKSGETGVPPPLVVYFDTFCAKSTLFAGYCPYGAVTAGGDNPPTLRGCTGPIGLPQRHTALGSHSVGTSGSKCPKKCVLGGFVPFATNSANQTTTFRQMVANPPPKTFHLQID